MAYEGALIFNYFNNYLKAAYIFHGSSYQSLGQLYLRNDTKGYSLFDRMRFLDNQLFLSGGVEQLKDNTDHAKKFTTTYWNINYSLAYYPRWNFPSLTVGLTRNTSSNGTIHLTNVSHSDSSLMREDISNRYFVQTNYEFHYYYQQNAMIDVSTTKRDDKINPLFNTKNLTLTTSLSTFWTNTFQTTVSFAQNSNTLPQQVASSTVQAKFNYSTLLLNARYVLFDEKLVLSGTGNSTFGNEIGRAHV